MIQRIQTLFLAAALFLMGLTIWLPLGEIAIAGKIYSFSLLGIVDILTGQTIIGAWYLIVLAGIILFFQVINIFNFKKRVRQVRMAILNIILMFVFIIGCWVFINLETKLLGGGVYSLKMALIFPLIAILSNYLAIRAIKRDEALVRSVDRIR